MTTNPIVSERDGAGSEDANRLDDTRLAENMGEESLTDRELQVLQLIRDGHRNKQIADRLSISETTVNFHIKNLVGKLGANDRAHAVCDRG